MHRTLPWRHLLIGGSRVLRCASEMHGSATASSSSSFRDQVEENLERESKAMGRIAFYPHRSITRPVLPIAESQILSPLFTSNLMDLRQVATDLHCISISAPKIHWDAAVVLLRGNPNDEAFEVWVNPTVPGYDDRHSIAPMYGMWENCISCGATVAWVVRPQRITCTGYDEHGIRKTEVLGGMRARCLMHELDHLSGKTILHQTTGPEFVCSSVSMSQRHLWPANFPSAEAHVTYQGQFFDYVQNTTIIPPGMEAWYAQNMRDAFDNPRIEN